jgi:hypothetical protein
MTNSLFTTAVILLGFLARAGQAQDAISMIQVDTILNIHTANGSPVVSEAEARAAVEEANKLLRQAGIRLNVEKVNMGSENPGHPDERDKPANAGNQDGDASMTSSEFSDALKAGNRELDGDSNVGAGRGHKIYFTYAPEDGDEDTVGLAVHYNRVAVVSPILAGSTADTGETIAHEFGHAASLGVHHTTGHGSSADDTGHVDDEDNIMKGSGFGGTEFTPAQAEEMRRNASKWGTTQQTSGGAAPEPNQPQSGGAQDDHNDCGCPEFLDISFVAAFSEASSPSVTLRAMFAGYVPEGLPVNVNYVWLFDADADPGTGDFVNGVPGIERAVEVAVFSDGITPPIVEASLTDYQAGAIEIPLPDAEWIAETIFRDRIVGSSTAEPFMQRVEVEVEKGLLNLIAPIVPVTLVSGGDGFEEADFAEMILDMEAYADRPVLNIAPHVANVGDSVDFTATGMTPDATATLFLDGLPVSTDIVVEPDGSVAGAFSVTRLPAAEEWFYVTLQDDTGRSPFTILQALPQLEDLESYPDGSQLHGEGGWKGWDDDPAFSAPVTGDQARSGAQAMDVSGGSDLVREYGSADAGAWSYSAWQYIPLDFESRATDDFAGTYFVLLNTYHDGGPYNWSVQVGFDSNDGMMNVFHGAGLDTIDVPYETDRWVKIQSIVDLENDWTRIYYDEQLVTEYSWAGGVIGEGGGALDIAAVDLYANGSTSVYYDDLVLEPITGCGNALSSDADEDGLDRLTEFRIGTDACEEDTDQDGPTDAEDNCPTEPNPDQADCDDDGVGDVCAITSGASLDCNHDALPDECQELIAGDFDGNGEVNLSDHAMMAMCMSGPCSGPGCEPLLTCCFIADFDSDGDVDLADHARFQGACRCHPPE